MMTFESLDIVHFAHPVHVQGIWVKFIHAGRRVKVKVTGAKTLKIPIPAMKNKLQLAVSPFL